MSVHAKPALPPALSIALLVVIQLVLTAIVQPHGDFPLNDDWTFALSALWLDAEHRVRLSNWAGMNLLPQTLAGGLVVASAGFSFDALRHLTQAVAVLASLATFAFFRAASLRPVHALVATLVTLAMPSWPVLANSYMTDLYSLVFLLAAGALFIRMLERPSMAVLALAAAFAAIGTLQRQVVAVVPFAFMLTWLWIHRARGARAIAVAVAPLAVTAVGHLLYQSYLRHGPGIPEMQQSLHARVVPLVISVLQGDGPMRQFALENLASIIGYLGLFAIGWIAWWGAPGTPRRGRLVAATAGIVAAGVALAAGWLPPFKPGNTIDRAGIGPFALYGVLSHPSFALDRSPGIVWRVAGAAAAFGFVALCALAWATLAHVVRERARADPVRLFLALSIVAYLAPFIVTDYFDRYLLPMLPFVIALWSRTWPHGGEPAHAAAMRGPRTLALAWIAGALALSAAATHDYFAWNRARWDAIRHAEARGATPQTLDGGYEYNGFHNYEARMGLPKPGKSWWWVNDDAHVVAFAPVAGYAIVARWPVDHWLPRTPAEIVLLQRQP